ncbi:MAG: S1C family serine protease [Clostridia bacterium]
MNKDNIENNLENQETKNEIKPKIMVIPQKVVNNQVVSSQKANNQAVKKSENSIIAMCEELEPEPIVHTQVETNYTKPKNRKVLKNICATFAFLSVATAVGFGSAYFLGGENKSPNTTQQTLDIVTNTNSPIDLIPKEGEVLTVPQIYEKVAPSTVGIQADSIFGTSGTGTGIIMSEDGYIITNNHVIDGADIITVVLHDDTYYKAEIIGKDEVTDIAVIKINPSKDSPLVVAEFGDSSQTVVGEVAITIGNPGGLELQGTLTGGYISAVDREMVFDDKVMNLLQIDAAISPGNSGGPLINQYGQVIGINTIKIAAEYYEGLGFAIPINEAKPIIDELLANGYVSGRPSIGITAGYDISKELADYNNVPQGLLVKTVDERSDAYAKGIKENDIIIGVNGEETTCAAEINEIKEQFVAGEYITLTIYRAGKVLDINVRLMDTNDLTQEVEETQSNNNNNSQYNFSFDFPFGN